MTEGGAQARGNVPAPLITIAAHTADWTSISIRSEQPAKEAAMATPAAVLMYVLALLGRSADSFPPIVLIAEPPPFASKDAEAFVLRDPPRIFLITSTVVFQEVQRSEVH